MRVLLSLPFVALALISCLPAFLLRVCDSALFAFAEEALVLAMSIAGINEPEGGDDE